MNRMKLAGWWKSLDNKDVQCVLCPQNCIIGNEKTGFCKVRKNIDGKLYSLNYGYPSAINIDPIEKKPLFHFYPGTRIFSVGTIGCNFDCKFCQNYEISRNTYERPNKEFLSPDEVVEMAINNECKSIAFTYNEPTVFGEYVLDIAKCAKDKNLETVSVTNGFINNQPLKDIYKYIDAVNIDLKSITNDFYKTLCRGEVNPVLDAIIHLYKKGTMIELTNLVIPTHNDSMANIEKLIDWIVANLGVEVPLHFSAFYPTYKLTNLCRTPRGVLDKARQLALLKGMKYVYEGNVMTEEGYNTYCPRCKKLLIERDVYTILANNLRDNLCSCGEEINIIQ